MKTSSFETAKRRIFCWRLVSTAAARKRRTKQFVKELLAKDFVKLAAKRDKEMQTIARKNMKRNYFLDDSESR